MLTRLLILLAQRGDCDSSLDFGQTEAETTRFGRSKYRLRKSGTPLWFAMRLPKGLLVPIRKVRVLFGQTEAAAARSGRWDTVSGRVSGH